MFILRNNGLNSEFNEIANVQLSLPSIFDKTEISHSPDNTHSITNEDLNDEMLANKVNLRTSDRFNVTDDKRRTIEFVCSTCNESLEDEKDDIEMLIEAYHLHSDGLNHLNSEPTKVEEDTVVKEEMKPVISHDEQLEELECKVESDNPSQKDSSTVDINIKSTCQADKDFLYKCINCGEKFKTSLSLEFHMQEMHIRFKPSFYCKKM